MKKVWFSMLILFLVFSLISCGNGKNGTSKEIQTIKDEQQVEQKFEIEPYSWVSRKPILKNSELSSTEGSWQFESERYKKLKEEGKEELEDGHKLGERLILYIKVRYINNHNLLISEPFPPSTVSCVSVAQIDNQLIFDAGNQKNKRRLNYEKYYDENTDEIKDDLNIYIQIVEGHSEYTFALKFKLPKKNHDSFYDINKDKGPLGTFNEIFYENFPIYLESKNFSTNSPGKDFFESYDLYINEIDVNGTIKGKYGEEEFIIPAGDEWQSKMKKQELSRDLFVYDWPYKESGEWKKSSIHRIMIRGRKRKEKGGWTSSEVSFLYTNDDNLLQIAKKNKRYTISEFKKLFNLIKEKHPDFTLNFKPEKWERISIGYYPPIRFDEILPKTDEPKFISQIKIINYSWRIYYY